MTSFGLELPRQRHPAPPVQGKGLDQKIYDLAAYRGKLVLLHFWASFCLPCREELPQLQGLWQQKKANGLVVVSVALDRGSLEPVQAIVDELKISFPVITENTRALREKYEIYAMPTTYVIGRDGRIIGRVVGARDWQTGSVQKFMNDVLKE